MPSSTEVAVERAGRLLAQLLIGAMMIAFGGFFDWLEYKVPPTHTTHLAIFTAIAFIGVLVAAGKFVFPVIQQVIVIAGQTNLPWVGGRRAGDPPSDKGCAP